MTYRIGLAGVAAAACLCAGLSGPAAKADLPLIGPGGIDVTNDFLPAPLPQANPARIVVTWDGGEREVLVNCLPATPPAGSPVGTLAWARDVEEIGTGAIVLVPVNGGNGWRIGGVLLAAGGPKWQIDPQPWQPGLGTYTAHLIGDGTVTATGRIDVDSPR